MVSPVFIRLKSTLIGILSFYSRDILNKSAHKNPCLLKWTWIFIKEFLGKKNITPLSPDLGSHGYYLFQIIITPHVHLWETVENSQLVVTNQLKPSWWRATRPPPPKNCIKWWGCKSKSLKNVSSSLRLHNSHVHCKSEWYIIVSYIIGEHKC